MDAVGTLAELPERGRVGRVPGTRELVVSRTPYVVAYRVGERAVEIFGYSTERGVGRHGR
ncbi:MAG TPA: type II toxin-antitoxin system RelE/ParE family toxin [Chloroflexota bacterium]|nr:type II toxin-antitoxin system RelE/ParE family toxin [Chloroflexota bacterium]